MYIGNAASERKQIHRKIVRPACWIQTQDLLIMNTNPLSYWVRKKEEVQLHPVALCGGLRSIPSLSIAGLQWEWLHYWITLN